MIAPRAYPTAIGPRPVPVAMQPRFGAALSTLWWPTVDVEGDDDDEAIPASAAR